MMIHSSKKYRIHFIGIGGSGMNGLATLAKSIGYIVSGSDAKESQITSKLRYLGIRVEISHKASNLQDTELLVVSTAISAENPELIEAKRLGLIILHRAEFLGSLMSANKSFAITGTHGKTTTSSMVAQVFEKSGKSPSFVLGGLIDVAGEQISSKLGNSDLFVAEADESDASFLKLFPTNVIITNIDPEHMETYDHDTEKLKSAYIQFVHRTPFFGTAVVCKESKMVREIIPHLNRKVITYGLSDADFTAKNIIPVGRNVEFDVYRGDERLDRFTLSTAGSHNVLNALATIILGLNEGLEISQLKSAMSGFATPYRRFNIYDLNVFGKDITIIDDYGHHPEEIEKTLMAMQDCFPDRRLISVFQPHRYSRTKDLMEDFACVLSKFNMSLVLPIYSAGESEVSGVSSAHLVSKMTNEAVFSSSPDEALDFLEKNAKDADVILFQGAGSIMELPKMILKLSKKI